MRAIFYEKATVTLRPTAKGTKEIGEEHEMYAMKYLLNKPVTSFKVRIAFCVWYRLFYFLMYSFITN